MDNSVAQNLSTRVTGIYNLLHNFLNFKLAGRNVHKSALKKYPIFI